MQKKSEKYRKKVWECVKKWYTNYKKSRRFIIIEVKRKTGGVRCTCLF